MKGLTRIRLMAALLLLLGAGSANAQDLKDLVKKDSVLEGTSIDPGEGRSSVMARTMTGIQSPSPDAQALGKFADVQVGLYTGVPSISIPFFSLSSYELSTPISISYHAGGVKVEEIASMTGLGWALNAGGMIMSSSMGQVDKKSTTSSDTWVGSNLARINDSTFVEPLCSESGDFGTTLADWMMLEEGRVDTESDMYTYNFMGFGGEFVLNGEGKPVMRSPNDLKIEPIFTASGNLHSFKARDASGNLYFFGVMPGLTTYLNGFEDVSSIGGECDGMGSSGSAGMAFTWHLQKIISASGHDSIMFRYEAYTSTYHLRTAGIRRELVRRSDAGPLGLLPCIDQPNPHGCGCQLLPISVSGWRIKQIVSGLGHVQFDYAPDSLRKDKDPFALAKLPGYLQAVSLYNQKNERMSKYELFYSYFQEFPDSAVVEENIRYELRLRLDSVREVSGNAVCAQPAHKFSYAKTIEGNYLPHRFADAQDHWGFYNSSYRLPASGVPSCDGLFSGGHLRVVGGPIEVKSTGRESNINYMKAAALYRIDYPMGGYTVFDFEGHTYDNGTGLETYKTNFPQSAYASNNAFVPGSTVDVKNFSIVNPVAFHTKTCIEGLEVGGGVGGGTGGIGDVGGGSSSVSGLCRAEIRDAVTGVLVYDLTDAFCGIDLTTNILPAGSYQLIARAADCAVSVKIDWDTLATLPIKYAGGLRVKQRLDSDSISDANDGITHYEYKLPGSERSSGILMGMAAYVQIITSRNYGGLDLHTLPCAFYVLETYAQSTTPLGFVRGSSVAYTHVSVMTKDRAGSEGKSITEYFAYPDRAYPPLVGFDMPSAPILPSLRNVQWNGLVKRQQTFKREGGFFKRIRAVSYEYAELLEPPIYGARYAFPYNTINLYDRCELYDAVNRLLVHRYKHDSRFVYLKNTYDTVHDQNDALRYATLRTENFYDRLPLHHQKTRTISKDSHGKFRWTLVRYSGDYTLAGGALDSMTHALQILQAKNAIAIPIEQTLWMDNQLLSGSLNLLGYEGESVVPRHQYAIETLNPIAGMSYDTSRVVGAHFQYDPRYKLQSSFWRYDDRLNLTLAAPRHENLSSSIYAHEGSLAIAQILNAPNNRCGHTSFEDDSVGIYLEAKTGKHSMPAPIGTGLRISQEPLNGSYVFSVWVNIQHISGTSESLLLKDDDGTIRATIPLTGLDINKWILIEKSLSLTSSEIYLSRTNVVVGTTPILVDEVRLFPKGSFMKTYTYEIGRGVSSVTDANNITVYYEYDAFGRLKRLRDQDRNIVKRYRYRTFMATPCDE